MRIAARVDAYGRLVSSDGLTMKHLSPLRYPGGKARLAPFLTDAIDLNGLTGCSYYEPYAGGAGAALSLLKEGVVSSLHLNDKDRRVFSFWMSALNETSRLVDSIMTTSITLEEWHKQRAICSYPHRHARFDIGFAAFFMNRCNRSGVLSGAGPIGGYEQDGKWKLDVRFNPAGLSERILELGRHRESIHVSCQDAITFLKTKLPKGPERAMSFVYLDPPYVNNGQRLYLNAYASKQHSELSRYIQGQKTLPWIMSYDDSPLIRKLYASCRMAKLPIMYSLQVKRSAHELVIAPKHLVVPSACQMLGLTHVLKKAS